MNRAGEAFRINKEDRSMKKVFSVVGVAALLAASVSIVPVNAQDKAPVGPADKGPLTQQQVKNSAAQAAQVAKQKWNALTPAQQQHIAQEAQVSAQAAQQKWNSMTPQQR